MRRDEPCNLVEGRTVGKRLSGRRRIRMVDNLYMNSGYEVLKRTTEDRSTWRNEKEKCQKNLLYNNIQLKRIWTGGAICVVSCAALR